MINRRTLTTDKPDLLPDGLCAIDLDRELDRLRVPSIKSNMGKTDLLAIFEHAEAVAAWLVEKPQ